MRHSECQPLGVNSRKFIQNNRFGKKNASLNKKESILFKIEIFQGRRQNHKKLKKTQQE